MISSIIYKHEEISPYVCHETGLVKIINDESRIYEDFTKIIWVYWEGEIIPYIVQKCIHRIKILNHSFKVVFLTPETLSDYLPDFRLPNTNMPLANKTDLIRLELLYKYGGIWMDATIVLNESLDWLIPIINEKKYDCIGFWKENSTSKRQYPIIESWFLCCPPHNIFIKAWLDELSPLGNLGSKKYFERIKQRKDYKDILQNIDRPEYLLVYLAQQIVMQKKNNFNVYLQSAEKTAFYYQERLGWNIRRMYIEFMIKRASSPLPFIVKLISGNVKDVGFCYEFGFMNRKSIIGNLFYD